jgi:hypothetical protein
VPANLASDSASAPAPALAPERWQAKPPVASESERWQSVLKQL